MRFIACAIVVSTGVVGLIGSALAVDLTGAEIKAFLTGKTIYLETTAASASGKAGQGVIYWGEDGNALYKTPTGAMFHGKNQRPNDLSDGAILTLDPIERRKQKMLARPS